MNSLEEKIFDLLCELRDNYFVTSAKAELESEGSTFFEISKLKTLVSELGLDLTVKIGGCEAINDLYELKDIGLDAIVAPMIESSYAFKKYIQACRCVFSECARPRFYINIETDCGYKNFDNILASEFASDLSGIVLGRSDMAGSLGLERRDINSDLIFGYALTMGQRAKLNNKEFIIGGAIDSSAISFLKRLPNVCLDKFETRKVVFDSEILQKEELFISEAISKAFEFELLWLNYKRDYLGVKRAQDLQRIAMLESANKSISVG